MLPALAACEGSNAASPSPSINAIFNIVFLSIGAECTVRGPHRARPPSLHYFRVERRDVAPIDGRDLLVAANDLGGDPPSWKS